ncbi:MAG TPA: cystathionine gamma-synthase family protein, partial [Pyrodictium sp.]|nr:cystathionine gamma-synthase family protein [Pyrodictium sp.]
LVFIETVGNPTLRIPPIDDIIKICGQEGCTVVVDNTFATPVIYRPVEAGADMVVESMTKYIGGHNDVLGGLLCSNHIKLKESIWEWRKLTGTIIQPLDAYLVARGLKTLHLRVKYSSKAAMEIAKWLADRPEVVKVHYPGLPDHPDHSIASRLFDGLYGGVVSFEIKGGAVAAKKFLNALKTIVPAPSLGGTESIATYPYESSHRNLSEEEKRKLEITPGLIRLSVGLENVEDLIADMENALKTSQG